MPTRRTIGTVSTWLRRHSGVHQSQVGHRELTSIDTGDTAQIPPFNSFSEFEEKVASLMQKDLRVVEEALDLDVALPDFGKVASTGDVPEDAHAAFFHRLAED